MLSKKLPSISRRRLRKYRFFTDRNLGAYVLPGALKEYGFDVTIHDSKYPQVGSYDPWIFYECGKQGLIVITADRRFMKSFPHMAGIALGRTTVLAFTSNNYNAGLRVRAFINAYDAIHKELKRSRRKPFIGCIGMDGSFRVVEENPLPNRAQCDPRDWASFEEVCAMEGVLVLAPVH